MSCLESFTRYYKLIIPLILIILIAPAMHSYTKYDYFELVENHGNELINPYTIYEIKNPETHTIVVSRSDFDLIWTPDISAINGYQLYRIKNVNTQVNSPTCSENYYDDENLTEVMEMVCEDDWSNEKVPQWVEWEPENIDLEEGETMLIKVAGTFNWTDGLNGKREIDHIPSFYGYDYPEYSWWNASWNMHQNISITNNNYSALIANYPVNITLNTSDSTKFNANCSDIRIAYNGTEVDWYNSTNCGQDATVIHFRIQSAIEGNATDSVSYKLYYDNPTADLHPYMNNATHTLGYVVDGDTDLLAHFEDNTDDTGNHTLTGSTAPDYVPGRFDNAGDFDGSADSFDVDAFVDFGNSATIEFWYTNDTVGNDDFAFDFNNANGGNVPRLVWGTDSSACPGSDFWAHDGVSNICYNASSHKHGAGVWNHLSLVWDGSVVKAYHNGVLDATLDFADNAWDSIEANEIGDKYNGDNSKGWDGKLDEFRISYTQRTPMESYQLIGSSYPTTALSGEQINKAPWGPITVPTAGENLTGTIEINATAMDEQVTAVYFWVENGTGNYTQWMLMTMYAGDIEAGNWSNSTFDTTDVPDGLYNITLNISDGYLENVTSKVEVTIDNNQPYGTILTPSISNVTGLINVNVTALDGNGAGVLNVYYWVENGTGNYTQWLPLENYAGSNWNSTLDALSLTDGLYNITFNITDYAGLQNTSLQVEINVDNKPPYGIAVLPANDSVLTSTIAINVTAIDAVNVSSVYIWFENSTGNYSQWTALAQHAGVGGTGSGNWSVSFDTAAIPDGIYNITFNMTDELGNQNSTVLVENINISNTYPVINNITLIVNSLGNAEDLWVMINTTLVTGTLNFTDGSSWNTTFDGNYSYLNISDSFVNEITFIVYSNAGYSDSFLLNFTINKFQGISSNTSDAQWWDNQTIQQIYTIHNNDSANSWAYDITPRTVTGGTNTTAGQRVGVLDPLNNYTIRSRWFGDWISNSTPTLWYQNISDVAFVYNTTTELMFNGMATITMNQTDSGMNFTALQWNYSSDGLSNQTELKYNFSLGISIANTTANITWYTSIKMLTWNDSTHWYANISAYNCSEVLYTRFAYDKDSRWNMADLVKNLTSSTWNSTLLTASVNSTSLYRSVFDQWYGDSIMYRMNWTINGSASSGSDSPSGGEAPPSTDETESVEDGPMFLSIGLGGSSAEWDMVFGKVLFEIGERKVTVASVLAVLSFIFAGIMYKKNETMWCYGLLITGIAFLAAYWEVII